MAKRINAISFENFRDKTGAYPVIRAMSKIVGNKYESLGFEGQQMIKR